MEIILAKIFGALWEFIRWLFLVIIGLLTWLFLRHEDSIKSLKTEVSVMKVLLAKTVNIEHLEEKAKEIRKDVASDHQRIYDKVDNVAKSMMENQSRSLEMFREDLSSCNRAVMDQINGPVMEQISEIRQFIFNHIERKPTDRN